MRIALSSMGLCVVVALAGCGQPSKSARGFHLPDGDPARGQATFVELKCNSCHTVVGADLPAPVVEPASRVTLGGPTTRLRTDGMLFTSIVDPSHELIAGYRPRPAGFGHQSVMGDFSETMTVRELIDIVAFLQSSYVVIPPDLEEP